MSILVTIKYALIMVAPHLGHAYTLVLADAIKRWQDLRSPSMHCRSSTGTDEHGTKVAQAAAINNQDPLQWCDLVSSKFLALSKALNAEADTFVRTTSIGHRNAVQHFWVPFLAI